MMKMRKCKRKKIYARRQGTCSFAYFWQPLQARYYGQYTVHKKISNVNYIVNTPGRRKKKQLCHVYMLKHYVDRDSSSGTPIVVGSSVPQKQNEMNTANMNLNKSDPASSKLHNYDSLKDLDMTLSHLEPVQIRN